MDAIGLTNLKNIICKNSFDKHILIWGASHKADKIITLFEEWGVCIYGFIDSNESIHKFEGYEVFNTEILKLRNIFVYIALEASYDSVIKELDDNGHVEFVDYWYPNHLFKLDGTENYSDLYGNTLETSNETAIIVKLRDGGSVHIESKKLNGSTVIASQGQGHIMIDKNVQFGNNDVISTTNGLICIESGVKFDSDVKLRTSSGGTIRIGKRTSIQRQCALVASFNAKIDLNEDCMLSYFILVRAGNSHNMIDLETGIHFDDNNQRDVILGKHVWVGMRVTLLNGVYIGAGSMIGANSFICKRRYGNNCCIAGNPAKVMKKRIAWMRDGVSMIKDTDAYCDFVFDE